MNLYKVANWKEKWDKAPWAETVPLTFTSTNSKLHDMIQQEIMGKELDIAQGRVIA